MPTTEKRYVFPSFIFFPVLFLLPATILSATATNNRKIPSVFIFHSHSLIPMSYPGFLFFAFFLRFSSAAQAPPSFYSFHYYYQMNVRLLARISHPFHSQLSKSSGIIATVAMDLDFCTFFTQAFFVFHVGLCTRREADSSEMITSHFRRETSIHSWSIVDTRRRQAFTMCSLPNNSLPIFNRFSARKKNSVLFSTRNFLLFRTSR